MCTLCNKKLSRKDYLTHFKAAHTDVRLGCPKCPQTYHSPELLNVHYRHFHAQQQQQNGSDSKSCETSPIQKEAEQKIDRCQICSILVADLKQHNADTHHTRVHCGSSGSRSSQPRQRVNVFTLHCDICSKTYHSQREFTNHRRRKDFCKPPVVEEPPTPKRRIGIIRRSL